MAMNGSSDHLRATSGLPPASDIPMPMSAFVPISSALPPATDVAGTLGERLSLTHNGSRGSPIRDTLPESFSHFVTSMTAPVASGWSDGRVGLAPTGKAPPYHGAHPERTLMTCSGMGSRHLPVISFSAA